MRPRLHHCVLVALLLPACLFGPTATPVEDEDMGAAPDTGPDMVGQPEPEDMSPECARRDLASCTVYERLTGAVLESCDGMVDCGLATVRFADEEGNTDGVVVTSAKGEGIIPIDYAMEPDFVPAADEGITHPECGEGPGNWAAPENPHYRLQPSMDPGSSEVLIQPVNPQYDEDRPVLLLRCPGLGEAELPVSIELEFDPAVWIRADRQLDGIDELLD